MESLIEKISAYNIFNNIIPGAVFCYFFKLFFLINLGGDGTIYNLCLFYFWGVFTSRIGSLILEWVAIKIKILKHAPYSEYLIASKSDGDIKTLLEVNNMLRTFAAVFLCLIFIFFLSFITQRYNLQFFPLPKYKTLGPSICGALFLIMMFAYKKQTSYIFKRIKNQGI